MLLKNDLKQSDLCSMNLLLKNIYTHTAMYHFGLNKVNSCLTALFFIQKSNLHLHCKYSGHLLY